MSDDKLAAYLANGGVIEVLPPGATGDKWLNHLNAHARAVRERPALPRALTVTLDALQPGDTAGELGARIGETLLNAYQRLRRLEQAGKVRRQGKRPHTRWWPK